MRLRLCWLIKEIQSHLQNDCLTKQSRISELIHQTKKFYRAHFAKQMANV